MKETIIYEKQWAVDQVIRQHRSKYKSVSEDVRQKYKERLESLNCAGLSKVVRMSLFPETPEERLEIKIVDKPEKSLTVVDRIKNIFMQRNQQEKEVILCPMSRQ